MKKLLIFVLMFFAFPCMAGEHARHFLQIVLNNMQENYQHSIGVPPGRYNLYVHKDGKKEAVYDSVTGKLVNDPVNRGSYNYFPYQMGVKHFLYDRFPWLHLGNSREDTSSYEDRLMAWIDDFAVSFEKLCRVRPALLEGAQSTFSEDKIFADIMEKIFSSFLSDARIEKMLSSNSCMLFESFKKGNREDLLYFKKALTENFKNGPLTESQVDALYYAKIPRPKEFE